MDLETWVQFPAADLKAAQEKAMQAQNAEDVDMTDEQTDKRMEERLGGDVQRAPPTAETVIAGAAEAAAARARFEAATAEYDRGISAAIVAQKTTGEPYYRMLDRGAITEDMYWTIARWSRLD